MGAILNRSLLIITGKYLFIYSCQLRALVGPGRRFLAVNRIEEFLVVSLLLTIPITS
jgi:hypothetical protein